MRHDAVRLTNRGYPAIKDYFAAVGFVAVHLQVQPAARRLGGVLTRRGVEQDKCARALRLQKILPERFDDALLQVGKPCAVRQLVKGNACVREVGFDQRRGVPGQVRADRNQAVPV